MSTSAVLPSGQFITSIDGKRCTAVPRNISSTGSSSSSSTTATLSFSSSPSFSSSTKAVPTTTTRSIISSSSTTSAITSRTTQATADGAAVPIPAVVEASSESTTSVSSTLLPSSSSSSLPQPQSTSPVLSSSPSPSPSPSPSASPSLSPSPSPSSSPIEESAVVPPAVVATSGSTGTASTVADAPESTVATGVSSSEPPHAPFAAITPVGTVQSSQTDIGAIASSATASSVPISIIATSTTPTAEADVGQTSSLPLLSATSSIPSSLPSSTPLSIPSSIPPSNPSSSTAAAVLITVSGDASSFTTSVQSGTTDSASSTTAAVATTTNALSNTLASAASSTSSANSSGSKSGTAAMVGGVIGGLALLGLVALLLWLWRRRTRQKRRSTLLTPLSADPAGFAGRGRQRGQAGQASAINEKGAYEINRGSIGPTPIATRAKASIAYSLQQARNRVAGVLGGGRQAMLPGARGTSPQPSVNMNRGNSQFGNGNMGSRNVGLTPLDRAKDWWSRMANAAAVAARGTAPSTGGNGSQQQPDFLTLLGMDENELSRAAQNKRTKKRRSNGGSSSSNNNFLGPFSVDYSNNPFSDDNVLDGSPAAGQAARASRNPFSDDNAGMPALQPNTYTIDPRRSRGQAATPLPVPLPPPPPEPASSRSNDDPAYRASSSTVATVDTRRNRFRSDPFDLERPERLQVLGVREPMPAAMAATPSTLGTFGGNKQAGQGGVRLSGRSRSSSRPASSTHARTASFTSKYTSGASMYDWSEPGPDVGPAATQWDDAAAERHVLWNNRKSELQRNHSNNSGTSVGKAL